MISDVGCFPIYVIPEVNGKNLFLYNGGGGEGIFPNREIIEFIGVVNMDRERYLVYIG